MTAWGCRRYLHGAICACCVIRSSKFAETGCYLQGRVLQRQGSKEKKKESNFLLILDVHFRVAHGELIMQIQTQGK